MSVTSNIVMKLAGKEVATGDLRDAVADHLLQAAVAFESGTTATTADRIWTDTRSAAAAADTIDLLGSVTDITGTTISFVNVVAVLIKNNSSTTGETLTVGAGSNPFRDWFSDSTDKVIIKPGGAFMWYAGTVDDASPGAGTEDIITIDPGANTISYSIAILGRSA